MKLYQSPVTPNSRRVRIFLAEKGIEVPTKTVDLAKNEHRDPAFTRINPFRQVPALKLDDGTVVTESLAICRFFEELYPKPALFGASSTERVMVDMWQRRMEFGVFLPIMQVFRHSHPAMAEMEKPQIAEWADVNRPRVAAGLEILNGQLKNYRFVAGDAYSVADITALVAIDFMRPARLKVSSELTHLERWLKDISERPSAQA